MKKEVLNFTKKQISRRLNDFKINNNKVALFRSLIFWQGHHVFHVLFLFIFTDLAVNKFSHLKLYLHKNYALNLMATFTAKRSTKLTSANLVYI